MEWLLGSGWLGPSVSETTLLVVFFVRLWMVGERREGFFACLVCVDAFKGFSVRYAEVLKSASGAVSVPIICSVVFFKLVFILTVFDSVVVIFEFTVFDIFVSI